MGGRLKAAFLLLLMFGLGMITGTTWERYAAARRPVVPIVENPRLRRFYHDLELSTEQEQAMNAIFLEAHARATQINEEVAWDLSEVQQDSLTAIQNVLTPEQRIRFEVIRHRLLKARRTKHHLEPTALPGAR